MPIGATSTRPASASPIRVRSPVFGRWKVTVRSARTTGIGRVARGQVDRRRRVDREDRHAGRAGAAMTLDRRRGSGSRSRPRTPVPSSASTTTARLVDALAQDRDVARDGGVDPRDAVEPVEALPVRAASARRRAARSAPTSTAIDGDAPARQAARRDEPVAAVVAGAGEDQHRAVLAGVRARRAPAPPRPTAVPACSISVSPGDPAAPAPCGRGRSSPRRDRGPGAARRPSAVELVERERLELGVVRGQGHGSRSGTWRRVLAPRSRSGGQSAPHAPAPVASADPGAGASPVSASTASRTACRSRTPIGPSNATQARPAASLCPLDDPPAQPAGSRSGKAGSRGRVARRAAPRRHRRRSPAANRHHGDRRAVVAARRRAAGRRAPDVHQRVGPVRRPVAGHRRVGDACSRRRVQRLRTAGRRPARARGARSCPRRPPGARTRSRRPRARCTARRPAAPRAPRPWRAPGRRARRRSPAPRAGGCSARRL